MVYVDPVTGLPLGPYQVPAGDPEFFAALHYPNYRAELPSFSQRGRIFRREHAWSLDRANQRPDIPPPYSPSPWSPSETIILEQWRKDVLASIDARVAHLSTPFAGLSPRLNPTQTLPSPEQQSNTCQHASDTQHRALLIPEILDEILRQANPSTIYAAWHVSKGWRDAAKTAITMKDGRHAAWIGSSTLAVEYGQRLDPDTPRRQPTPEELSRFIAQLPTFVRWGRSESLDNFLPALLTQHSGLPEETIQMLSDWDDKIRRTWNPSAPAGSRRPHHYWLDFTQLELNPLVDMLFLELPVIRCGKCEIGLSRSILDGSLSSSFLRSVGQMFFTHPPCKSLGLYIHDPENTPRPDEDPIRYGRLGFLERIHDEQGIRVDQLLQALTRHSQRVHSVWKAQVLELKRKVATGHWIDDVWNVPNQPTVYLIMDNNDLREGVDLGPHKLRKSLFVAGRSREKRQCEWTRRELIEPAESSTPRCPVQWDRMGLH